MFLLALLVFYAIKQLVFVVAFPPFTGHDEAAHYAYTPIYWVSDSLSLAGQQFVLRLTAIPFGMVTVFLAYRLAVSLFPGDRFLATSVPIFVALQPQISYEAAMVNNDIVAIALYSGVLSLLVPGVRDRFTTPTCVWLGVVLGLALLTKGTAVTAVPVIAAAIVMTLGWRRWREWIVRAGLVALPAMLLSAPWYVFLYRTYGNLSGFPQIAELQRSWNYPEGSFLSLLYSLDFIAMRFSETWGEFGWRRIPLDSTVLVAIGVPLACAFVGLIVYAAGPNLAAGLGWHSASFESLGTPPRARRGAESTNPAYAPHEPYPAVLERDSASEGETSPQRPLVAHAGQPIGALNELSERRCRERDARDERGSLTRSTMLSQADPVMQPTRWQVVVLLILPP
ncbi:MAG: glycosyltransferase family 39 protein [Acidobacteria bacterium]|nr:glycosyltransferase family 39 protein [Acidobacteriota bacterium]